MACASRLKDSGRVLFPSAVPALRTTARYIRGRGVLKTKEKKGIIHRPESKQAAVEEIFKMKHSPLLEINFKKSCSFEMR